MRVVRITEPGDPEVLRIDERAEPEPAAGEVRVEVHAAALNRADLLQRRGAYPAPPGVPPDVPGLEFAGVVDEAGEGVDESMVGAWVAGLVAGGAYAESLVVSADLLLPVPPRMDFVEAAAIPEAFLTAWDALCLQAGLREGESVLIHAAGSGVGTAAVQIARVAGAKPVFGTASAPKLERLGELGLFPDVGVDYRAGSFLDAVRRETGGRGVDVVLDLVGAVHWADNVAALARRGRILLVGLVGGSMAQINLAELLRKRITVIGTVLRSRPLAEKQRLVSAFRREMAGRFEDGGLRPVVDRVFPLEQAAEAHRFMGENRNTGKIVLRVR